MPKLSKKDGRKKRVGIKWLIFATLTVFIFVTLLVIWFFQVKMLSFFYLSTKFSELDEMSEELQTQLGDEEALVSSVYDRAAESQTNINVYAIREGKAVQLVRTTGYLEGRVPFLSDMYITRLYHAAQENQGDFMGTLSFDVKQGRPEIEVHGGSRQDAVKEAIKRDRNGAVGAICVTLREYDGVQYLIIQISELSPIQTTITTLQKQFLWIGIILLLLALTLAWIMSKLIGKPIERVNRKAKRLADGDYPTDFSIAHAYREIGELGDTLQFASIELSRTDALQQELISNISHDLRTPLTMIRGYSEMIRDIPGENTPENMQVIIDETQRLSDLVSDMLDISKIRAGTQKPSLEPFSLTQTVQDTMYRYDKLINKDGYRIEFVYDSDVTVVADRRMILQVIYNLINNAVHYTGTDLYVCVRQKLEGTKVRISVYDTGDGISEEEIPFIWDRYYKVDKVHKRAEVGSGLGLSIVKGILELHGAEYGVNSTLGVGSEFWFELDAVNLEKEI